MMTEGWTFDQCMEVVNTKFFSPTLDVLKKQMRLDHLNYLFQEYTEKLK